MKAKGWLLDDNYDLDGFKIGNTDAQNQALILLLQQGELKEYPLLGVGIENVLNDNDLAQIVVDIRRNFEADGMKVKKVEFDNNLNLNIDASYRTE